MLVPYPLNTTIRHSWLQRVLDLSPLYRASGQTVHRELSNTILNEEGLKFDRDGNWRTAYSLRHTYICLRLMEGADIYQIAKNCRTSVEMIGNYYASHIRTSLDAAAINVRRPRPPVSAARQEAGNR